MTALYYSNADIVHNIIYSELFKSKVCNMASYYKLTVLQINCMKSTQSPMFKGGECHVLYYIVFRIKFQVNEFFLYVWITSSRKSARLNNDTTCYGASVCLLAAEGFLELNFLLLHHINIKNIFFQTVPIYDGQLCNSSYNAGSMKVKEKQWMS